MEDRLIKFARIIDAGSFTRAAQLLHISQPALTTAIKKLERELHAELLIRSSHAFSLTTAGKIAYDTAKIVIAQTQNLETHLREAAGQKVRLNVGMIDSIAHLLFIQNAYLEELEQGAQVSLSIDNSSRLIASVDHDELDVALITQPARLLASLTAHKVGDEPLVLVIGTEHVSRLQKQIASGQVDHFLSYNQASLTFQIVSEYFHTHGVALEPTFYSTSPEIMLQLVLAGRGAAVLPYLLVKPYITDKTITALRLAPGANITRTIIGVHRTGRLLSGQTEALLTHIKDELETLSREAAALPKLP